MSDFEIEDFLNKVESGLEEAQYEMLVEKALCNQPVIVSDRHGHVQELEAKLLLAQN